MALYSTLALLIVLTVVNYRISRSVLYPPFIFCFMWTLDLFIYCLGLIETYEVHVNTLAIIGGGAFLFSLGGSLSYLIPAKAVHTKIALYPDKVKTQLPKVLLIIFLVLCFPDLIHHIFAKAAHGTGPNVLAQARDAAVSEGLNGEYETDPIVSYFIPLSTLIAVLFLLERRDKYFWSVVCMSFVANLISGERTGFLVLISAVTGVYLIQANKESFTRALKALRIPVGIFLFLYIALIFLNRSTDDVVGKGIGSVVLLFFVTYLVGPMLAFDYVVQHASDYAGNPNHTFQFFLKIADILRLTQYTPPPRLDEFLLVPFPANVYTIYKFYFIDLGLTGCLICMFVIGLIHSALFRKARSGSILAMLLFAMSLNAVILSVFDDLYYAVGFYLRALAFALIYLNLRGIPFRLVPRILLTSKTAYPPTEELLQRIKNRFVLFKKSELLTLKKALKATSLGER